MNRLIKLLFFSLVASSTIAAEQSEPEVGLAGRDITHVSLSDLDETTVHKALHLYDRYRHGVYRRDSEAVEAIQQETHMNLQRDTGSNSTVISQPTGTPTSSSSSPESTTSTTQSTSSSRAEPTTTTPTTSSTGSSETSTQSASQSSTPTSPTASGTNSPSPTTMATSTSSTEQPSSTPSPFTSTFTSTTTLPNGELSTVTAITVVHPTVTAHAGSATGPAPGLQTGSGASITGLTREVFLMMGGAAVVAMAL